MVTDRMNKLCALLTGTFLRMKRAGQACVAGMGADEKMSLTFVVIAVPGATNRHQMGILVNALRDQDKEKGFVAVGMCLDVTLTDQASGKATDALYVCLEDREGNAEDLVFSYRRQFFGGFKLDGPQVKVSEPRVYVPKGDELVSLVKGKIKSTTYATE